MSELTIIINKLKEKYDEKGHDFIFKARQLSNDIGYEMSNQSLGLTLSDMEEEGLITYHKKTQTRTTWKTNFGDVPC